MLKFDCSNCLPAVVVGFFVVVVTLAAVVALVLAVVVLAAVVVFALAVVVFASPPPGASLSTLAP
jgi:hypothetical protein